ncbi:ubiquinone biosynthesis O-methyltransferase, mitochondrial [Copidosoma floridanum]|uniref:ubiquinone biosynthesis O-methyltransferase, mitochondrial n=1 Tax=Copidosoma floridanum TaxID=29053 RepID=UPI0006C9716E|nr:ubiquinone biosynthesis O-methyltransferase, mitochondrial [Copidosoma floridanum]
MRVLSKKHLSKFGAQTVVRFCTSVGMRQQHESTTTVDAQDVSNFSKLSENWWDVHGDMRALHAMNPLRVQFIRDGLLNAGFKEASPSQPLEGVKILDIGCGGGILSEPLARIGAQVTGLDASKELVDMAKAHVLLDKNLASRLNYVHTAIEDFSQENKEKFDAVVASEILEHVIDQELFLKSCTEVLKPKGSIFITTFNKNFISWLGGIIGAEYLLRLLPVGTHDWNKFISPEDTRRILEKYNCKTKLIHGIFYNPAARTWSWIPSTAINYALHAIKTESIKSDA